MGKRIADTQAKTIQRIKQKKAGIANSDQSAVGLDEKKIGHIEKSVNAILGAIQKPGWKTYTAAAIITAATVLEFLGYDALAKLLWGIGGALGFIGVRMAMPK